MKITIKAVLAVICLAILGTVVMAENDNPFPSAKEYTINSRPSFLVKVGDSQEVVKCKAQLLLRASDSYITATGTRKVDLNILNWNATGYSHLLGGELKFRMLPGVEVEETSFVETFRVVSEGDSSSDFPAKAQFSLAYELETPFGTMSNLTGVTQGHIKSFPPVGDLFMMRKGGISDLMSHLLPAPLSALSAGGMVQRQTISVTAISCDPDDGIDP